MSDKCPDCGKRTRAMNRCLSCKTAFRRMEKACESRGWTVDWAGGAVWVWDRQGEVLASGRSMTEAMKVALEGVTNEAK